MILIIDNYDSFTDNLTQYVGELGFEPIKIRNDEIEVKNLKTLQLSHIILSPGPGQPKDSGICLEIIKNYANQFPILGICLGHQSIGYVYGGKIEQLKKPMHGKISSIKHNGKDIFHNLPNPFNASRYHSLIINKHSIPKNLEVTAWTSEGLVMGCKHKVYNKLRGIQFHPESLWTSEGKKIIQNFLLD
uniref:Anthranilate synthase component 2 n=1 Tax=Dasyclonium flaccidum TaxID=2007274 RepID=A0A1Z1MKU2_9FLOR|nr:Anthranilate synthase component II [Dasyclonium flaccidum]ARW66556.1 Anthranilate synthase component II [Dasyclonium flaccidum]